MEAPQQNAAGKLINQWKAMDRGLRIALIAIVLLVVALIIVILIGTSKTEYEILYAGIDPSAAADVYALLEEMGVSYKIEGTTRVNILIPAGEKPEMLLRLSNEGYPGTDEGLYNYFDNLGLGSTEFDKKISWQFTLEQRIAYSLKQMEKIEDAVVTVTLGEKQRYALSQNNSMPAQASVLLTLKSGASLTNSEAEGIRDHVVKSVQDLQPEKVTITDNSMRTYRYSDGAAGEYGTDQIELRNQAQQLIQEQVYTILTPVFGPGYVTVSAAVELDFDKRSTQSVTYEPPGSEDNLGIVVSLRQTASQVQSGANVGGVVGFDPNGAGTPFYPENWGDAADSPYFQYTQELNAEVNEVREQVEEQSGKFRNIEVAVMVDAGEEWEDQLALLQTQVARAVGVDAQFVSIMRTRFKANVEMEEILSELPDPNEIVEEPPILLYAIAGGVVLLFIFIILMILRSNKKKRKALQEELKRMEDENRLIEARQIAEEQQLEMQSAMMEDDPSKVRLGEIQGLADKNPDIVAQLLRNWLTDEYGR